MNQLIPLKCNACGSNLKPVLGTNRFTCPNCGSEFLATGSATGSAADSEPSPSQAPQQTPPPLKPFQKRTAADVLLELLDRVPDTKQLDILLDTGNLLKLLLLRGYTPDQIKQELLAGKLPGQLLLDLLDQEPDPAVLLNQLGPRKP